MHAHILIQNAPHAYLLQRYDMGKRKMVAPGVADTYGRSDPKTGAYYKALGTPSQKEPGKVSYSSDLVVGLFYPETIVVYGTGDSDKEPLPFEILEAFVRRMADRSVTRGLLPKGYVGGKATWSPALLYLPDFRPSFYGLDATIKEKFPGLEVYQPPQCSWYEVWADGVTVQDGKFMYEQQPELQSNEQSSTS